MLIFKGADLFGINLTDGSMAGANLSGATLNRAIITRAEFSSANLEGAHILNPTVFTTLERYMGKERVLPAHAWRRANFSGILDRSDFRWADLSAARFVGAQPDRRKIFRSQLAVAPRFGGADLTFATFRGADLTGADLSRADLSRTDFTGAIVTGLNLTGADLDAADFTGVIGFAESSASSRPGTADKTAGPARQKSINSRYSARQPLAHAALGGMGRAGYEGVEIPSAFEAKPGAPQSAACSHFPIQETARG